MANKNSESVRRVFHSRLRHVNALNRKPRAVRKAESAQAYQSLQARAAQAGVSITVYNILRREASHAQILKALSWRRERAA